MFFRMTHKHLHSKQDSESHAEFMAISATICLFIALSAVSKAPLHTDM